MMTAYKGYSSLVTENTTVNIPETENVEAD